MLRPRMLGPAVVLALFVPSAAGLAGGGLSAAGADGETGVRSADRLVAVAQPIDTSDREAVAKAWRTRWDANLSQSAGWTGRVKGCRPGRDSRKAKAATLESVNFARAMAGLDPVRFSRKLSARAQKAALIMAANRSLSHYPPKSWKCWTQVGAAAAGRSNLALSYPRMTAGGAIKLYMDDPGAGNTVVGHRRWVLNPDAEVMGSGLTSTTHALDVFGPQDKTNADPAWVSWPTPGWFPAPLEPRGRWSLSSGDADTDFSRASVVVRRGAKRLPVTTYKPQNGYAEPTLVFDVDGVKAPGTYRVTVRHIRHAASATRSYKVRLFQP